MKQKKPLIKRFIPLFIMFVVLTVLIISLVTAYYVKNSDEVPNNFAPAVSVNPTVEEEFDGKEKKNVYFKVGKTDYPVYVRAKIVITWKNADGIVYFSKPIKNTDYTLDLNSTDWEKKDGFYYYKKSVESGGQTSNLINSCVQLEGADVPDGYTLSVELLVQTIQAVGNTDDSSENPAWDDAGWENAL